MANVEKMVLKRYPSIYCKRVPAIMNHLDMVNQYTGSFIYQLCWYERTSPPESRSCSCPQELLARLNEEGRHRSRGAEWRQVLKMELQTWGTLNLRWQRKILHLCISLSICEWFCFLFNRRPFHCHIWFPECNKGKRQVDWEICRSWLELVRQSWLRWQVD